VKRPARSGISRGTQLTLGVAAVVGGAVLWVGLRAAMGLGHTIADPRFLLARLDLESGQPVTSAAFRFSPRGVLAGDAPSGAITDQDLWRLDGMVTRRSMRAGDILVASGLERAAPPRPLSERLVRGKRAYLWPAPPGGLPVLVGDRVDVHWVSDDVGEGETLVEGATILETGVGGNWVIALTPVQIALVEKARRTGKLTVSLRSAGEPSRDTLPPRPRRRKSQGHQRQVEIWVEGS